MDTEKLSRAEIFGMVAGLILIGSLFLEWFALETDPAVVERGDDPDKWVCGIDDDSCTGFETFPILRWLLIAAAAAPLILSWILIRGHQLTWPRGELTAIVGLTAFVLIAYNGLIDRPGDGLAVDLSYGYWLAILTSLGIFAAGGYRAVESGGGAQRKPPATF